MFVNGFDRISQLQDVVYTYVLVVIVIPESGRARKRGGMLQQRSFFVSVGGVRGRWWRPGSSYHAPRTFGMGPRKGMWLSMNSAAERSHIESRQEAGGWYDPRNELRPAQHQQQYPDRHQTLPATLHPGQYQHRLL